MKGQATVQYRWARQTVTDNTRGMRRLCFTVRFPYRECNKTGTKQKINNNHNNHNHNQKKKKKKKKKPATESSKKNKIVKYQIKVMTTPNKE